MCFNWNYKLPIKIEAFARKHAHFPTLFDAGHASYARYSRQAIKIAKKGHYLIGSLGEQREGERERTELSRVLHEVPDQGRLRPGVGLIAGVHGKVTILRQSSEQRDAAHPSGSSSSRWGAARQGGRAGCQVAALEG